jgi:hypothetical protein
VTVAPLGTIGDALRGFLFRGPSDVIVYVNAKAQPSEVDALRVRFQKDPLVKSMTYLDHDAAFAEFQSLFSNQPAISNSLTSAETPTSFKILLTDVTREEDFRSSVVNLPAVFGVIDASGTIRKEMTAVGAELKPKLQALLSSGGTPAMIQLVIINQRLYAALDKNPSARLFGAGGVIGDDEVAHLSSVADTFRLEMSRDCNAGGSS